MAHGLNSVLKRGPSEGKAAGIGSRRIFAPQFKLQVLDSYRNDADCKGNQRATARKYGIHRRQIQKWLQVEGNLRNSVIKGGKSHEQVPELALRSVALRQRDDEDCAGALDRRVPDMNIPTLSPGSSTPSPAAPSAPLDFTTHSRASAPQDPGAPIDLSLKKPSSPAGPSAPVPHTRSHSRSRSPSPRPPPSAEIWDLSTKRKLEDGDPSPKPVKLFKPYLDDDDEARPCRPQCCSAPSDPDALYYNNNHMEYAPSSYPPYHDNFYYTASFPIVKTGYLYSAEGQDGYGYDPHALKQRQSYSLEFKLRAIDCYYSDAACRGNQRAVATKLNIHRRQVQKWLKQEEELRQRNVSGKHMHAVR